MITDIEERSNSEIDDIEKEENMSKVLLRVTEDYSILITKRVCEVDYLEEGSDTKEIEGLADIISDES
jgi:hypothetical protein